MYREMAGFASDHRRAEYGQVSFLYASQHPTALKCGPLVTDGLCKNRHDVPRNFMVRDLRRNTVKLNTALSRIFRRTATERVLSERIELVSQLPTPLVPISFRGHRVWVKRDDMLSVDGLSGSKARKFYSLSEPTALDGVEGIASFGGIQSNAMRSLALFSRNRGIKFVYYARRRVPQHLRQIKVGNFREALDAGMELRQLPENAFIEYFERNPLASACDWIRDDIEHIPSERILFVPQGGAWPAAELGIKKLAEELCIQVKQLRRDGHLKFPRKRPLLVLPSGTGATAFFLAKCVQGALRVITVPVAGSERYLSQQLYWLQESCSKKSIESRSDMSLEGHEAPEIICPRISAAFADIREDKFKLWIEMQRAAAEHSMHFDLVYAARAWEELWLAWDEGRIDRRRDVIYLNTGGTEGNSSMLDRYVYNRTISQEQREDLLSGIPESAHRFKWRLNEQKHGHN